MRVTESDRDGEIVAQTAAEPTWLGEIVGMTEDGQQYAVWLIYVDDYQIVFIDADDIDAYE